jgi:hypothetical protein
MSGRRLPENLAELLLCWGRRSPRWAEEITLERRPCWQMMYEKVLNHYAQQITLMLFTLLHFQLASCIAVGKVSCLSLSREDFISLLGRWQDIADMTYLKQPDAPKKSSLAPEGPAKSQGSGFSISSLEELDVLSTLGEQKLGLTRLVTVYSQTLFISQVLELLAKLSLLSMPRPAKSLRLNTNRKDSLSLKTCKVH